MNLATLLDLNNALSFVCSMHICIAVEICFVNVFSFCLTKLNNADKICIAVNYSLRIQLVLCVDLFDLVYSRSF